MSFIFRLINYFLYIKKMAKKINEDAVTIKKLLKRGLTQKKIAQLLGLKKQKVSYWANHEIKTIQTRRKKL